jgi:hypothetical protein
MKIALAFVAAIAAVAFAVLIIAVKDERQCLPWELEMPRCSR